MYFDEGSGVVGLNDIGMGSAAVHGAATSAHRLLG